MPKTRQLLWRKGDGYQEYWLTFNPSVHKQRLIFYKTKGKKVNPPYKAKRISLSSESKNLWIVNGTSTREAIIEEVGTKFKTNIRETCERIIGPARYSGQPASFATALKQGTSIRASDLSVKNRILAGAGVLATQKLKDTISGAESIDRDPEPMQSTRSEKSHDKLTICYIRSSQRL